LFGFGFLIEIGSKISQSLTEIILIYFENKGCIFDKKHYEYEQRINKIEEGNNLKGIKMCVLIKINPSTGNHDNVVGNDQ